MGTRGSHQRPQPPSRSVPSTDRPEICLRELALQSLAHARGNGVDRRRLNHEIILAHVEGEQGARSRTVRRRRSALVACPIVS